MKAKKLSLTLAPALIATLLGACSTAPTMPDKAWTVEPTSSLAHGSQSAADYYVLGRHEESGPAPGNALAAYRKAVEIDPDFFPAWNALGILHARLGQYDEAVAALQKAVKLEPESSRLLNNLGYAKLLAERDEAAATTLRHAVMIDRGNRRAWRNLAEASRRLGDHDGAERARARASGETDDMAQVKPGSLDGPESLARDEAAQTPSGPQLVKIAKNVYELRSGSGPQAGAAARPGRAAASPRPASATASQAVASPASGGVRYEVTNGVGRSGLASRVAGLMRQEGMASPRLSNQPPFDEPITMVEYREGFRDAAEALGERLPFRPALVAAPSNELQSDVRLLLGHDLVSEQKCAALDLCPQQTVAVSTEVGKEVEMEVVKKGVAEKEVVAKEAAE